MSKRNRIEIDLDPSIAAALAAPPARARAGRPGQANNPAATDARSKATFDLDPATIQAIRDTAADLGVPVYAVAQKLLDYALSEYQLDRLELTRKPVTTVWTLE